MVDLKKTYDAIVVGSGAAGGIAAKELTEGGLQVLLLEAGPRLDPAKDFLTHRWPYEMPFRGFDRPGDRQKFYPNQIYTDEYTRALYIEDPQHPYTTPPDQPYTWVRSRCVGGKILHWSRNARRLSNYDFKAAERDGYGENWPLTYEELAPFYDKVESFIGVSGSIENIPHLPDGRYLPPFPLNCGERIVQKLAPSRRTRNAGDSEARGAALAKRKRPRRLSLLRKLRARLRCRSFLELHLRYSSGGRENRSPHALCRRGRAGNTGR